MTKPMNFPTTCDVCFRADDVTMPVKLPNGTLQYTCTASHGGSGPHTWTPDTSKWVVTSPGSSGGDNLTDDLLDPLMMVFRGEDRWLEYGVVEHRLRLLAPAIFADHVADSDHIMFGPRTETASKNRFAIALNRLSNEHKLVHEMRPSTGTAWKRDSTISYYAVPPAPPRSKTLTWADYCAQIGRSDDWTDDDRAGLHPPEVKA